MEWAEQVANPALFEIKLSYLFPHSFFVLFLMYWWNYVDTG
jgi:hypothetical protein